MQYLTHRSSCDVAQGVVFVIGKKVLLMKPFSIRWNMNVSYRAFHFKYYLVDFIGLNLM